MTARFVVAAALAAALAVGCGGNDSDGDGGSAGGGDGSSSGGGGGSGLDCGPTFGTVKDVTDGDTIVLESGEKIRYLLVDTPETTGGNDDCFGQEAKNFNRDFVLGKEVRIEYGEACTDRFGRLLAYVSVNDREVNSLLVERGYACVLFIPPAGTARRSDLEAKEKAAKAANKGLWGACSTGKCFE